MDSQPFKNNHENDNEIAADLLRFTADRLPQYAWFVRQGTTWDPKQDQARRDRM